MGGILPHVLHSFSPAVGAKIATSLEIRIVSGQPPYVS